MPMKQQVQVFEDPTLHRQQRADTTDLLNLASQFWTTESYFRLVLSNLCIYPTEKRVILIILGIALFLCIIVCVLQSNQGLLGGFLMASLSDYLESGLLHHLFRGEKLSQPTNIAIALCSSVPSESDNGSTIQELPSGTSPTDGTAQKLTGYMGLILAIHQHG